MFLLLKLRLSFVTFISFYLCTISLSQNFSASHPLNLHTLSLGNLTPEAIKMYTVYFCFLVLGWEVGKSKKNLETKSENTYPARFYEFS